MLKNYVVRFTDYSGSTPKDCTKNVQATSMKDAMDRVEAENPSYSPFMATRSRL